MGTNRLTDKMQYVVAETSNVGFQTKDIFLTSFTVKIYVAVEIFKKICKSC